MIGSGGREHALAWKRQLSSGRAACRAGESGIAGLGKCHPVRAEDGEGLLDLARNLEADLVVVGPEAPLVSGVADELRHAGVPVFGPGREAAQIEGSKTFAKDVMRAAGVPTAETLAVARAPCVVKVDGLAAGKGVFVCLDQASLDEALRAVGRLGQPLVIEELLEGEEVSLFAVADGRNAVALAPARDYKRIGDGNTGPNTGGMGSFSPVAGISAADVQELLDTVHLPVLAELASRGRLLRRSPVRGADADRGRAEGRRVQLPLRRPRDPGDPAASRRGPARGACGGRRRRPGRDHDRDRRRGGGHGRARVARLSRTR